MGTSSMSIHGGSSFPGQVYCHAGRGESLIKEGARCGDFLPLGMARYGEIWTGKGGRSLEILRWFPLMYRQYTVWEGLRFIYIYNLPPTDTESMHIWYNKTVMIRGWI